MSRKRVKGPSASGMSSSAASSPAVVHHPDFALDDYLAPYEGITKIRRLIYVAQRCPDLQLLALQRALTEIKKTVNTELYMEVMSMAKATLGEGALGPGYEMDDEWLKRSNRYFNDNLARLEGELNTRVRESVKHRIRESYNAVASHLMLRGDCTSALAKYLECKDYSEEPAHNIEASLNAIKASILMGSMGHVKNQYDRTQQFGRVLEENPLWVAKMQASMGLYELKRGNFGTAADYFISTGYELHGNYTDVMTGRDVAAYAALCALCSFDRHRLRTKLIDNEDFSKMIDLFPEMRTICRAFYNCQYATCFKMLGDLEKDFLLDIYMAPHIRKIIATVRERAMIQYFRPFTSVRIPAMATAFNVPLEVLEADLVNLIGEKKIQARIDSANKILYAKNSDDRLAMFETGLQAGERFVRDSRSLLLSMSLLQHDFVVRHPKERLMMSEMSMEAMAEMMSKGV